MGTTDLFVEVVVCLAFAYVLYKCCFRCGRVGGRDDGGRGGRSEDPDDDGGRRLRRFREASRRLREAGVGSPFDSPDQAGAGGGGDGGGGGGATTAARRRREELIKSNLFARTIEREESVRELSRLLAVARGGRGAVDDDDEELGGCGPAAPATDPAAAEADADAADADAECEPRSKREADPEGEVPAPSAPPSPAAAPDPPGRPDNVAAALAASAPQARDPPGEAASPNATPAPRATVATTEVAAPLGGLWSNLTQVATQAATQAVRAAREAAAPVGRTTSERRSERGAGGGRDGASGESRRPAGAASTREAPPRDRDLEHGKLECPICLEPYAAGDVVAWAKDGGGGSPSESPGGGSGGGATDRTTNDGAGCDHVYHRACLTAWLRERDDCPLCRRKVVHEDAANRFRGWEGLGLGG